MAEPRGIAPTLFQPKLKIEFSLFTPLSPGNCRVTSPLKFRGENMEPRGKASGNFLIKKRKPMPAASHAYSQ